MPDPNLYEVVEENTIHAEDVNQGIRALRDLQSHRESDPAFPFEGNLYFEGGTAQLGTLAHAATAPRTWTLPDASGNLALESQVVTDHGALGGLGDDDHAQYAAGAGRAGGQSLAGGTGSAEDLTLQSTTDAMKGKVFLGSASAYDQANDRLGLGTTSPSEKLEVVGTARVSGLQMTTGAESGKVLTSDASGVATWQSPSPGVTDHGALTGLGDDDHAQYVMGSGRAAGQSLAGGTGSAENLTLQSTTDATKGKVFLGSASAYDQANDRLGIGTTSPSEKLEVSGTASVVGFKMATGAGAGKVLTSDASGAGTWQNSSVQLPLLCGGRLSASANPVTSGDVAAGSTLYYVPYVGNQIALYDGSQWVLRTFSSLNASVTGLTADEEYDVFAYWTGSAVSLELVAWGAFHSEPPTQDGVRVKSGDATRRYLGTIRTISFGGTRLADSQARRLIWNQYHRVSRSVRVLESADSWTYASTSYRYANGNSANRIEVVCGIPGESSILLTVRHYVIFGTVPVYVAIGRNSSTTPLAECLGKVNYTNTPFAFHAEVVPFGHTYYSWLERSNGNVNTFYGDAGNSSDTQSGMVGVYDC